MKRKKLLKIMVLVLLLAALGLEIWLCCPPGRDKIYPRSRVSLRLTDRQGSLLREVLSGEGTCSRWVNLEQISPLLRQATLIAEDKRFYRHCGVDFRALARAARQNLRYRAVVSGGSTITQQLARNVYRYPQRNLFWKGVEALDALRLERHYSKAQLLELYLNRIPYGNQAYGVEAASRLYFDQPASELSPAQAAFLAGIPASPCYYDPYRFLAHALARQKAILAALYKAGDLSPSQYRRALKEEIKLAAREEKFQAPHFCDYLIARLNAEKVPPLSRVRTTLDPALQKETELLIKSHLKRLKANGVTNAAALVINNHSGEILAWVGSADYFNRDAAGQVNGVTALRQPGSALKPFTYGLALERGYPPSQLIPDLETHIPTPGGVYIPRNYDQRFHGPTRLRTALACSYNVSAIWMLRQIGVEPLLEKLHQAGFASLRQKADYYGLGLTLGNGEVSLLELTRAYCALARGGYPLKEKVILEEFDEQGVPRPSGLPLRDGKEDFEGSRHSSQTPLSWAGKPLFSPQVCYLLTDILGDKMARARAFGYHCSLNLPFPSAAKTGTSRAFTDNWAVGYTADYTVGVWVGNFDGKPMREVSGITGTAPLWREIMLYLHRDSLPAAFPQPPELSETEICPESGELPGPYCPRKRREIFLPGARPRGVCSVHRLVKVREGNKVISRVYEVYPPLYYGWMREQGLEFPPVSAQAASPRKIGAEELKILFPQDGDTYKIDPVLRRRYQTLSLQAQAPEGVAKLSWWVNGRKLGEAQAPFAYDWPLAKGKYRFQVSSRVKGRAVFSPPAEIEVY